MAPGLASDTTREGRGVLYVATGHAHVEAARASAASVRRTDPGLAIALFSDRAEAGPEFDQVIPVTEAHHRSKVDCLPRSPFAETLYLDSDTRVLEDLSDMFRLLERFDLAAAHVARSHARRYQRKGRIDVPRAFPQHNGGVILYRGTPAAIGFLETWRDAYHARGGGADQISFRETLWQSDIRCTVLPARYNARRYTWIDALFSDAPPPAILHTNRFHPTKHGPWRRRLAALAGPRV